MILSHAEILSRRSAIAKQNFLLLRISDCESAEYGWFVHASIHVASVIGTDFKDAQKQCRVDAIAVLRELENEPNCLDSGFPVRTYISFIPSLVGVYARGSGLV